MTQLQIHCRRVEAPGGRARRPGRVGQRWTAAGSAVTYSFGELVGPCGEDSDGALAHTAVIGRGVVVGPPRSRAGVRTVAVPAAIGPEIVKHLMTYLDHRPDALVFTGPKGGALRRAHFNNLTRWVQTVKSIGASGLHFHDLRHTGNHLAAQTGATTKDLMARMGHDDMRAALIYQHATSEADREIAERLSALLDEHTGRRPDDDDGPAGASVPMG